jgi:hypothetical protein
VAGKEGTRNEDTLMNPKGGRELALAARSAGRASRGFVMMKSISARRTATCNFVGRANVETFADLRGRYMTEYPRHLKKIERARSAEQGFGRSGPNGRTLALVVIGEPGTPRCY